MERKLIGKNSDLEMRVKNLDKFLLNLQEKFEKADSEDMDWGKYNPQKC